MHAPPMCPWSGFAPANLHFCERDLCGWVTQPANTWSNVGFLIAGVIVIWASRREHAPRAGLLGPIAILTGIASAALHATSTLGGQLLDQGVMFLESSLFVTLNIARLRPLGARATRSSRRLLSTQAPRSPRRPNGTAVHRIPTTALASLLLALGCVPRPAAEGPARPTASSATAPPPPAPAGTTTEAAEAPTQAQTPDAEPAPFAPGFDREMACRRQHCYAGGAGHCLDTCYKYNHPRDPAAHEACNATCRRNYDVQACEDACARDRRAFSEIPAKVPQDCRTAMAACRHDCSGHAPNNCELRCLYALEACETRSGK